jgi:hypothetical protein
VPPAKPPAVSPAVPFPVSFPASFAVSPVPPFRSKNSLLGLTIGGGGSWSRRERGGGMPDSLIDETNATTSALADAAWRRGGTPWGVLFALYGLLRALLKAPLRGL